MTDPRDVLIEDLVWAIATLLTKPYSFEQARYEQKAWEIIGRGQAHVDMWHMRRQVTA